MPRVVLLSRSCDTGLDSVEGLLRAAGVSSARVNADELATIDLLVDQEARTACLNGLPLAPTVTWVRHFSARAIEGSGDPAHDMFLRDSWRAAASQLMAISGTAIRSRRPGLIGQLSLARRLQVAVPRTIVTTDLSRAHDAFQCPRLVIKAADRHFVEAAPGRLSGIFPTIVERRALSGAPCSGPPVIVQEYVDHEAELRVYYVHGRVHGFEVRKDSPADPWADAGRVQVRPVLPSPAVVSATRMIASSMSLRYGAFDFLIRAGTPVFLEVNPDGDWHWAERQADDRMVTGAVARMLSELHWEVWRTVSPTDGHGAGPVDLLAFLASPLLASPRAKSG